MGIYNYREHWDGQETPLIVVVKKFFADNQSYKITIDEFVTLVTMLSRKIVSG